MNSFSIMCQQFPNSSLVSGKPEPALRAFSARTHSCRWWILATIGAVMCELQANMVTKNEAMSLFVKSVIVIFVLAGLAMQRQQPRVTMLLRHQVAGGTFHWLPSTTTSPNHPHQPAAPLFSTNIDVG